MLELSQFTNDPVLARRCDALEGLRIVVDLERNGKAERQAGRDTFISAHQPHDIDRIRAVLRRAPLLVRVNPLHDGTRAEVDDAIARGADQLMLPMFKDAGAILRFTQIVDGRVPVVPLLETSEALASLETWIDTPGIGQVFVGLNDLHLSLGHRFMFEPLALGLVDRVAQACGARGLAFGFGGVARLDEGLLPGRDVLAEHVRLGSGGVILSRTFHRDGQGSFEDQVARLRACERELALRTAAQVESDRVRVRGVIERIAAGPR